MTIREPAKITPVPLYDTSSAIGKVVDIQIIPRRSDNSDELDLRRMIKWTGILEFTGSGSKEVKVYGYQLQGKGYVYADLTKTVVEIYLRE